MRRHHPWLCCLLVGCATADDGGSASGPGGKTDGWAEDSINDPDRLAADLVYAVAELPLAGRADRIPWPDSYWPLVEDGPNRRWQGETVLSPLEKYDAAYNGWDPATVAGLRPLRACQDGYDPEYYRRLGPAARWQSYNGGNRRLRDGKSSDADSLIDECDDLDGMQSWWGYCAAWAPAALLEPEPLHAVEVGGVRFEVSDIKALLIAAYDAVGALVLGDRCVSDAIEHDHDGRVTAESCRDTNAGAWHVAVTNLVGLRKQGLVIDRAWQAPVWNQPVFGYQATTRERSPREANALLGMEGDRYPFNDRAVRFLEVEMRIDWMTEAPPSTEPRLPDYESWVRHDDYHYVLEVDERGEVLGGEWLGGDHPDFTWVPTSVPDCAIPACAAEDPPCSSRESFGGVGWGCNWALSLSSVHRLLQASRE